MTSLDEWYESAPLHVHLLRGIFAPLTLVNPFFYQELYETSKKGLGPTLAETGEHLIYMSGWLIASGTYAAATGSWVSPYRALTGGTRILSAVAVDTGFAASVGYGTVATVARVIPAATAAVGVAAAIEIPRSVIGASVGAASGNPTTAKPWWMPAPLWLALRN